MLDLSGDLKQVADEERKGPVPDQGKSFQGSPEARESPVHSRPERVPDGWLEDHERVVVKGTDSRGK